LSNVISYLLTKTVKKTANLFVLHELFIAIGTYMSVVNAQNGGWRTVLLTLNSPSLSTTEDCLWFNPSCSFSC